MAENTLTKKDFKSDQEVRWCPGCGDYAILNAIQGLFAERGIDRSKTVFVSGIGCSSRFPYYMSTYGFHTIHGRAPAIATGLKAANPELDIWIITGDGDGLSIGGNHMAHVLRRNVDVNILLFNNEIYGLTKGQYSPTSPVGRKTKSSPLGSIDRAFNPLSFAIGCDATFVARTIDADTKHMMRTFGQAMDHRGTSFVEIMQNCVIFNKNYYGDIVDKSVRSDRMIDLRPGEKMIFGKESDKGLRMEGWGLCVTDAEKAAVWDPTTENAGPAFALSTLDHDPQLPTPYGVFRQTTDAIYDQRVHAQIAEARAKKGEGKLEDLVWAGETWKVD